MKLKKLINKLYPIHGFRLYIVPESRNGDLYFSDWYSGKKWFKRAPAWKYVKDLKITEICTGGEENHDPEMWIYVKDMKEGVTNEAEETDKQIDTP